MTDLAQLGEDRHSTCAYGTLTPAFIDPASGGPETPTVLPLCLWSPEAAPPAVLRAWGGAVELDRDCAVCPAFRALEAQQETSEDE